MPKVTPLPLHFTFDEADDCAAGPSSITSEMRREYMYKQKHLIVLLHSRICTTSGGDGENGVCIIPHCALIKKVQAHALKCENGETCSVPHCVSSKELLKHYSECNLGDCPVCVPFKESYLRLRKKQARAAAAKRAEMKKQCDILGIPYIPDEVFAGNTLIQQGNRSAEGAGIFKEGPKYSSKSIFADDPPLGDLPESVQQTPLDEKNLVPLNWSHQEMVNSLLSDIIDFI